MNIKDKRFQQMQEYVEPWHDDHYEVMDKYKQADELSLSISALLEMHDQIKESSQSTPITTRTSMITGQLMLAWHAAANVLYQASEPLSKNGFKVTGIDRLNKCLAGVSCHVEFWLQHIKACQSILDSPRDASNHVKAK